MQDYVQEDNLWPNSCIFNGCKICILFRVDFQHGANEAQASRSGYFHENDLAEKTTSDLWSDVHSVIEIVIDLFILFAFLTFFAFRFSFVTFLAFALATFASTRSSR